MTPILLFINVTKLIASAPIQYTLKTSSFLVFVNIGQKWVKFEWNIIFCNVPILYPLNNLWNCTKLEVALRIPLPNRVETWHQLSFLNGTTFAGTKFCTFCKFRSNLNLPLSMFTMVIFSKNLLSYWIALLVEIKNR